MKNVLMSLIVAAILVGGGALAVIAGGWFPIAATGPEPPWVQQLIHTAYEKSVARNAQDVKLPADIGSEDQILRGASSFEAMCSLCHTPAGAATTVQAAGMNPAPPPLADLLAERTLEEAYWVIANGVRMTGMPAFGPSHEPEQLWPLVAFLRDERSRDAEAYVRLVALARQRFGTDDGHNHSHGESDHDETRSSDEAMSAENHGSDHGHVDHQHGHGDEVSAASNTRGHAHGAVGPHNISSRLLHALEEGDAAQVETLLLPDVLIFESGGVERGFAEYAGHHMPADMAFARAVKRHPLDHKLYELGDHALYAGRSRLRGEFKGSTIDLISTETLLLKRDANAGWKVQHIHWSSGKEH